MNINSILNYFGNARNLSTILNIPATSITIWKQKKAIPSKHLIKINELLNARNKFITNKLLAVISKYLEKEIDFASLYLLTEEIIKIVLEAEQSWKEENILSKNKEESV